MTINMKARSRGLWAFLPIAVGLSLPPSVHSELIHQWPDVDGIDLAPLQQRFIEVYEAEPTNLDHLIQGFQTCSIDKSKLAKLSNINQEAMESVHLNNQDVSVKIKLDVKTLTLASTQEGCEALATTRLERVPNTYLKYFQVNAEFKHSFLIHSEYQQESNMIIEISGKEHESKTNSQLKIYALYTVPKQPINPLYPKENYYFTRTKTDYIDMTSYTMSLSPLVTNSNNLTSLEISRSFEADKITNHIVLKKQTKNNKPYIQIIGNNTYMSLLDSELDGLMITDNYSYATDKNQAPYSTSCHTLGKRINVFKKIDVNRCQEVSDDQIGLPDVYVDVIYKIRLDAKQKLAATDAENLRISQVKQSKNYANEQQIQLKKLQQKSAYAAFQKQQNDAKCSLNNHNWAYLGESCLEGLADGEGRSVNRQGLTFIGTFKAGNRITGDIQQDGEMIFSGDFKQDKPNGSAICLFEGEYEECRFFRGKRIDSLYKIRKENAKNLAKMEQIQAEQQHNQPAASQQNNNRQSNIVVDAIKKEGAKKAASFIFDQLF